MEDPETARARLVFDCFSALLLLLTALLGAYLPRYLSARGGQQSGTATSLAFHLGNMLSGGVMLSAGFCHLLADSLRQLAFVGRFPMAPFLAAVGYLITLLADQIVQVLTAEPGEVPASANNNQYSYSRLDKQQGSGDAIEMIAQGNSWSGVVPAVNRVSGLGEQGSVISRTSAWGSDGGLLEPVGSVQQLARLPASAAAAGGSAGRAGSSRPAGGFVGSGKLSVRVPDAAVAAGGLHSPCGATAASAVAAGDMALCVMATGSPRALTAGSIMSRSAGSSRGGGAAAAAAAVVEGTLNSSSNGRRVQLECSVAAVAAANEHDASSSSCGNGHCTLGLTDDTCMSHPVMPGPLQQQQQTDGHTDLLGIGDVPLQQQQHDEQERERQLLLGRYALDSAAQDEDHMARPLPCSQLLMSPTAAAPAIQPQQHCIGSMLQQQQQQHTQQRHWQANRSFVDAAFEEPTSEQHSHLKGDNYCPRTQHCCCCQSGKGAGCCISGRGACLRSGSMTEACAVAHAADHLELEITAGLAGAPNSHAHFQVFLSHQPLSFATTVLLACALCIHSVLEGVALGAQQTMEATQDIMLAIAAHKGLAAYALGASIVESKASAAKFWTVIAMFASATPIGIAIGYASSYIGHGSAGAAMSALASGTFLYVALNEVIPKELEHPDGHRLLKVAALLLGFGLMSLLAVWA